MTSFKEKLSNIIQKYGKVALGTHIILSASFYSLIYLMVRNGVDVSTYLQRFQIFRRKSELPPAVQDQNQIQDQNQGQQASDNQQQQQQQQNSEIQVDQRAVKSSQFAIAYAIYKILMPVRASITIALVPLVAKLIRK